MASTSTHGRSRSVRTSSERRSSPITRSGRTRRALASPSRSTDPALSSDSTVPGTAIRARATRSSSCRSRAHSPRARRATCWPDSWRARSRTAGPWASPSTKPAHCSSPTMSETASGAWPAMASRRRPRARPPPRRRRRKRPHRPRSRPRTNSPDVIESVLRHSGKACAHRPKIGGAGWMRLRPLGDVSGKLRRGPRKTWRNESLSSTTALETCARSRMRWKWRRTRSASPRRYS